MSLNQNQGDVSIQNKEQDKLTFVTAVHAVMDGALESSNINDKNDDPAELTIDDPPQKVMAGMHKLLFQKVIQHLVSQNLFLIETNNTEEAQLDKINDKTKVKFEEVE